MAPCGQKPEAAAFPGCGILHPSVRGVWACWAGDGTGSGGPWRRVEGSRPVAVFLRSRLSEPGAEISGGLAAPRLSTGIMHNLRVLAQDGSKNKTSARALGQRCPPVSLQKGDAGGEE